jgi:hypothetical protein
LTANQVVLSRSTAAVGRWDRIPGLAGRQQQSMRPHFEGIELQCECRQRQFQMLQFLGARVVAVIPGKVWFPGKAWLHGKSCMRIEEALSMERGLDPVGRNRRGVRWPGA